jgi:deazaflavin-dependent oxidoreductase (nitroreductase family)
MMPLPRWVARFNRRATNRVTGLFAGRLPGFGILIHTGRRSGRTYRAPINVFRDGDDYVIALTYGPDTDWVRNVLAAGGADLLTRGQLVRLTRPRLQSDPSLRWAPLLVRLVLGRVGATETLRLTTGPPPLSSTSDQRATQAPSSEPPRNPQ